MDYNTLGWEGQYEGWGRRKVEAENMALVFGWLGKGGYAKQMKLCGTHLAFAVHPETGERKLAGADFCRIRMCPQCAWFRSRKVFGQVSRVMDSFDDRYAYIFLTLTARNCSGFALPATLDMLASGYRRLMEREAMKPIKGWFRALEITYNDRENTYHPHYHVICAVNKRYFKSSEYVSHARFATEWQSAIGADYTPIVDVRRVKPGADGRLGKAVAEAAKYTLKTSEILNPDDLQAAIQPVWILSEALHGRRLVGFGGVFRDAHKRLNLDDPIDGDLTESGELRYDVAYMIEIYSWGVGAAQWMKTDSYIRPAGDRASQARDPYERERKELERLAGADCDRHDQEAQKP